MSMINTNQQTHFLDASRGTQLAILPRQWSPGGRSNRRRIVEPHARSALPMSGTLGRGPQPPRKRLDTGHCSLQFQMPADPQHCGFLGNLTTMFFQVEYAPLYMTNRLFYLSDTKELYKYVTSPSCFWFLYWHMKLFSFEHGTSFM